MCRKTEKDECSVNEDELQRDTVADPHGYLGAHPGCSASSLVSVGGSQ